MFVKYFALFVETLLRDEAIRGGIRVWYVVYCIDANGGLKSEGDFNSKKFIEDQES